MSIAASTLAGSLAIMAMRVCISSPPNGVRTPDCTLTLLDADVLSIEASGNRKHNRVGSTAATAFRDGEPSLAYLRSK